MNFSNGIYYSLNDFLRYKFGTKTIKLSLDAGFTCPNRDGAKGYGGCIFCSGKGSGDFSGNRLLSISEQIAQQKKILSAKWPNAKYIAYFQAFSNTYAPAETLYKKYNEALSCGGISALAIATRPDCISKETIEVLSEMSKKTYIWVELGLQSSNYNTEKYLNLRYTRDDFKIAALLLSKAGIDTVGHIILGLPNETFSNMMESVNFAISCGVKGIKLHSLHVIKGTVLYNHFKSGCIPVMNLDEYTDTVINILRRIPPNIVIHRLTGDGPKAITVSPLWSFNKRNVLNTISKKMRSEGFIQGDLI